MAKIRTYPHFDANLSEAEADAMVGDPQQVAKHAFFPFIEYSEGWTKFAAKGLQGKRKSRPIKYASRRDSCIYSHYREILSDAYERELAKRGIERAVLAYRRIPKANTRGNKSNIHFAAEAFSEILGLGDCLVYALDISSFFESIDHAVLKQRWKQVMGYSKMPPDHYSVFRNITRYSTVSREELYRALGFIGPKSIGGRKVTGYIIKRVPLQVCSGKIFRQKVLQLICVNPNSFGIPQGSPMSDVLANLYMLEFDAAIAAEMATAGGSYRRYSDDVLLIVPGHADNWHARLKLIDFTLAGLGSNLNIQPTKTTVHKFSQSSMSGQCLCERISGTAGRNGLEYLGFRFDGSRVFLRDSTRSRLQRKMTYTVKAAVWGLVRKNPGMGRAELKRLFNADLVLRKFYKVRDFETVATDPGKWTFWTYAIRAQKVFGKSGSPIGRQLRNFRQSIAHKANRLIDEIVAIP